MTNPRTCYDCGDDGHLAYDCPNRPYLRGGQIMRRDPDPPTADYLAVREELGMPSGDLGEILLIACPWCGRGPRSMCVNPGTGRNKIQAHDARYEAAGITPPRNGIIQRIAREQVAESRAVHQVI